MGAEEVCVVCLKEVGLNLYLGDIVSYSHHLIHLSKRNELKFVLAEMVHSHSSPSKKDPYTNQIIAVMLQFSSNITSHTPNPHPTVSLATPPIPNNTHKNGPHSHAPPPKPNLRPPSKANKPTRTRAASRPTSRPSNPIRTFQRAISARHHRRTGSPARKLCNRFCRCC